MQKDSASSPCLLGLFHVRSRYNPSVQHVFAIATRQHKSGLRQILTVNTSQERTYTTSDAQGECNAAIIYPITSRGFETLRNHFELANVMGITPHCDLSLYYFSKDMTPDPNFEQYGRRATDPFGRLEPHDPKRQSAYLCDPDPYGSQDQGITAHENSDGLIRARTNCVVMSRYAAHVAGVDEGAVDPDFPSVQRAARFEKVLNRVMARDMHTERVLKSPSGIRFVLRRHETDREEGLGERNAVYLTLHTAKRPERIEAADCLDFCEKMLYPEHRPGPEPLAPTLSR